MDGYKFFEPWLGIEKKLYLFKNYRYIFIIRNISKRAMVD